MYFLLKLCFNIVWLVVYEWIISNFFKCLPKARETVRNKISGKKNMKAKQQEKTEMEIADEEEEERKRNAKAKIRDLGSSLTKKLSTYGAEYSRKHSLAGTSDFPEEVH